MEKAIHSAAQNALCAVLRKYRAKAGLRQIDVATRIGEHQSFVSKYESGERRLDYYEIEQICKAIGVDEIQVLREAKKARHR